LISAMFRNSLSGYQAYLTMSPKVPNLDR